MRGLLPERQPGTEPGPIPPADVRRDRARSAANAGRVDDSRPVGLHSLDVEPTVTFTPLQRRAGRALGHGYSQRVTARKVGCDERTVRRWLTDVPGFREYVAECRE